MKELERHVDSLFADYRQTRETKELKEEILSNLEAKTADYIQEGMTREDAVKKAVESIKTVDYLIDGSRKIYFNRYVVEMFRSLLIYILIAWIVTIPMRVISSSIMINNLLTCAAVILGVIYFTLAARKDSVYLNEQRSFDTKKIVRFRILVWIVWVLFI
ncbi:MAG: permease prefix domain 1-containing protein, partial [Bacillota bacterium]|nr:permease prefix domain 1-containing protein [Bacillota bacterium]